MADAYLAQDLYVFTVDLATNSVHNYGGRSGFSLNPTQPTETIEDDVLDETFDIVNGSPVWEGSVDGMVYRNDADAIIASARAGETRMMIMTHPSHCGNINARHTSVNQGASTTEVQRITLNFRGEGGYRAGSTIVHPKVRYAHGDVAGIGGTKSVRVKTAAADALAIPNLVVIITKADDTITGLTVGWTPLGQTQRSVAVTPTQRIRSSPFAADAAAWDAQARAQGVRDIPFTFAVTGTGNIRFSVVTTY